MENKMKRRCLVAFLLLFISYSFNLYAVEEEASPPPNIGFSLNLLGPIFGIYSLGVSSFLTSRVQIGINGTYFDTRSVDPKVTGWQTQVRMNYFFSPLYKSGFYLGIFGGFESVQVNNNSGSSNNYTDPIGGVIPGYRWSMTKKLDMLLGVMVGYMYGDVQISPELSFVYLF